MAKIDDSQFERLVYSFIQESEDLKQFRGEMVGVLYDVTRRKGEVIKRLQINNWGGNTRQEAPELRLQVTSQKTKVEMEKQTHQVSSTLVQHSLRMSLSYK